MARSLDGWICRLLDFYYLFIFILNIIYSGLSRSARVV